MHVCEHIVITIHTHHPTKKLSFPPLSPHVCNVVKRFQCNNNISESTLHFMGEGEVKFLRWLMIINRDYM